MRGATWTAALATSIALFAGSPTMAGESRTKHSAPPALDRSGVAGGPDFVADAVCASCHPAETKRFLGSHHDLAMQPADERSVLGDFSNVTFEHDGVESFFSRRDGRFVVRTEGPDGAPAEYEIAYTFGVEPLQQYLVAFPGGRLQALPIAWDAKAKRWFDLNAEERVAPDDALHWTGRYQSWNAMCAECHSTNLRKHYDPDEDTYRTTWAEIDVGCQACHGPGQRHVAWASAAEGSASSAAEQGLVVDTGQLDSRGEVDACARCHSRRRRVSVEDVHGRPFLDDFEPVTLDADLYYPDGQIDEEVYVYGSFVQSRMYAAGVRCTDCHDPHALTLRAEGNALCTRCHQPKPDPRFPGLVSKRYDTKDHHHHEEGSSGALCVSCHMPSRTYMVVDPRRDHGLRVPRPDLSQTFGVPNACTGCHDDQSNAWASQKVEAWYGPSRRRESDVVAAIHDGRSADPSAQARLERIAKPGAAPAIVRATALSLLPAYGESVVPALVAASSDSDPLVRAVAARGLGLLPPPERAARLGPLLEDPVRAVRLTAASELAGLAPAIEAAIAEGNPDVPEVFRALPALLAEHEAVQRAESDLPMGRLNLGYLLAMRGRVSDAEGEYRAAIAMDDEFLPAYANLSHLYDGAGRPEDAEAVLREGIAHVADAAELHYSLGLLLAQQNRLPEAVGELRLAARGRPGRARIHYNLGLAEQTLGNADRAEAALSRAADLAPQEPRYAQALAIFHAQQGDFDRAIVHGRRAVELAPGSPEARSLLDRLEQQRARIP